MAALPSAGAPLRVLLVEDSPADATLLEHELGSQGFQPQMQRVQTEAELRAALDQTWDIVLADYALPQFGALAALAVVKETSPHLPVIVISGSVGEEDLVGAMKAGASDYLLKGNLSRLGAAIRRELQEAAAARRRRAAEQAEIEERRRAEEALRRSEERFRLIARATNDVLWDWDPVTDRAWWNEGLRAWGYDPAAAGSHDRWWSERVHPDDRPAVAEGLRETIEGGGTSWTAEYRFRRADGSYAHVYDRGYVIHDGAGRAVRMIGAMLDVSERRRLESQLLQAGKMEAVGRLAGGVAHDFNNLVTAIRGYADLGRRRPEVGEPLVRYLDEIVKASDRAASVVRQLLAFSRSQFLQPRVLDVRDVVHELEGLLRRLIGEDVELVIRAAGALGRVSADPTQVEQVIMNLVLNARDAMPQGGRLLIELANAELERVADAAGEAVSPGPYVMIAVSDTGHGMDAATQAHIFEPFFTTKEVGKGTGLGLATVHGIVKQSGGQISVYSELGRGTTFKIYLPRVDAAAQPAAGAEARAGAQAAPAVTGGTETLLLVEDEAGVRQLLQELLTSDGYTVLEASRPSEAARVAGAHPGRIDVLITDVVMPEMTGPELARGIARSRPDVKVLFMSGYTAGIMADKGYLAEDAHFLQKPFTAAALEAKLREMLDRPHRPPAP